MFIRYAVFTGCLCVCVCVRVCARARIVMTYLVFEVAGVGIIKACTTVCPTTPAGLSQHI